MNKKLRFIGFAFAAILLMMSCDEQRIAEQWVDIPADGWHKDSLCTFSTTLSDTLHFVDLQVGVRNNNTYAYSNLWLFISIISPSNQIHVDTVEVPLATPSGKWYGKGFGNMYTLTIPYRNNVRFVEEGDFTFTIQQGMRSDDDLLRGISSVGFRIQKHEEE